MTTHRPLVVFARRLRLACGAIRPGLPLLFVLLLGACGDVPVESQPQSAAGDSRTLYCNAALRQTTCPLWMGEGDVMRAPTSEDQTSLNWTSANPAVATVAGGGWITAVGAGKTQVTATQPGTHDSVVFTITVSKLLSMRLTLPPQLTLYRPLGFEVYGLYDDGRERRLGDSTPVQLPLEMTTGNASIVTLPDLTLFNGAYVTYGRAEGTASVTVRETRGGMTATAQMSVVADPVLVSVYAPQYSELVLDRDYVYTLRGRFSVGSDATLCHDIQWEVSGGVSIAARYDCGILIHGTALGSAYVTATHLPTGFNNTVGFSVVQTPTNPVNPYPYPMCDPTTSNSCYSDPGPINLKAVAAIGPLPPGAALLPGFAVRRLLLGAVLALHYGFAAFLALGFLAVPLGGVLGWRWVRRPGWRLAHLGAPAFVVGVALLGLTCPLTWAENTLRPLVGDLPVPPPVLFLLRVGVPDGVFSIAGFLAMTALAAALLLAVPPRVRGARTLRRMR